MPPPVGLRFILKAAHSIHGIMLLLLGLSALIILQSTPDNSNLQGKSKKVRVIGSSSYRELEENS